MTVQLSRPASIRAFEGPLLAFVFENPSSLVSPKYVIEYNNGRMIQGANAIIPDFAKGEHIQHVLLQHQLQGSTDRQRRAAQDFFSCRNRS